LSALQTRPDYFSPKPMLTKASAIAAARPRSDIVPRIVISHDYLTQRGGAERVVLAMHRAFPEAPIYTSLFAPDRTFPEFKNADVRSLPLDRIRLLRSHHRLALPLLAPAFSALKIQADVVLCSSSGWAHAVTTNGRKVVYCYTPARWLYQSGRYLGRGHLVARVALRALRPTLVRWDRRAAHSADLYLAQSNVVRDRIRKVYGIEALMLPAPHSITERPFQQPLHGIRPGFFLCVSRLLPYKNLDSVIRAFGGLTSSSLVIVGTGPEAERLRRLATENVVFTKSVTDAELAWLYANCLGVIAAAYEDFGLVPLEAAAFGKPSAALRWGGFLDTVIEDKTGIFFESPSPSAIQRAVHQLTGRRFDPTILRSHAAEYSESQFISRLRSIVISQARSDE
jgi:glycosyltransferase involved in cell wall biosynthesis